MVVGTGEKILRLDPEIQSYLKKRNILLEVQDTVSFVVQLQPLLEIWENLIKLTKGLPVCFCSNSTFYYPKLPLMFQ